MKRCALCVIALALLVAPAAASAQDTAPCAAQTAGGDPGEEYGRVGFQAQPIASDVATWLGEQFGGFWQQPRDGNWYLGRAPGPVTADEVRARALELVDARHDGEDEQRLRDRLRVVEQPYGEPELRRIQEELGTEAAERGWGVGWGMGVGCMYTDAWRVEFELFGDATPEIVAEARALAEPHGDKVRVVHRPDIAPPGPDLLLEARPAAPKVGDLIRVRGCRVLVRRSARSRVRSLKVRRMGRRAASLRVRLKDGRSIRGTVRLRSCARS